MSTNEKQEQIISARELHEKLGLNKKFTDWFKYNSDKLGLIEGVDFIPILGESTGGRPSADYHIKIDIAKHLSMISGGEKSHKIRKYFIEVEKAWNDPGMVMARALKISDMKIVEYHEQIQLMQPKA